MLAVDRSPRRSESEFKPGPAGFRFRVSRAAHLRSAVSHDLVSPPHTHRLSRTPSAELRVKEPGREFFFFLPTHDPNTNRAERRSRRFRSGSSPTRTKFCKSRGTPPSMSDPQKLHLPGVPAHQALVVVTTFQLRQIRRALIIADSTASVTTRDGQTLVSHTRGLRLVGGGEGLCWQSKSSTGLESSLHTA